MDRDIILSKKVNETTTISFHDKCRKIAGDRWYVEILCKITVIASENLWKEVSENDPHLLSCIRQKIGNELTYSISRIKNFVDEKQKDTLSLEIMKQMEDNLMQYFKMESFETKLFEKIYQEERVACLAAKNMEESPPDASDDEPADFSHLFR